MSHDKRTDTEEGCTLYDKVSAFFYRASEEENRKLPRFHRLKRKKKSIVDH